MASFTLEWSNSINGNASKNTVDFDQSNNYVVTNYETAFSGQGVTIRNVSDGSVSTSSSGFNLINSLRFSPTGDYLAVCHGNVCDIYITSDKSSLSLHTSLTQAGSGINDVAWSPDGAYVAYASSDGFTYIHDNDPANSFPFVTSVQTDDTGSLAVIFSYDSSWIIVMESTHRVVYDTTDWSLIDDTSLFYYQYGITINPSDSYVFHTGSAVGPTEALAWSDTSDWTYNLEGTNASPLTFHHTPVLGDGLLAYSYGNDSVIENISDINSWVTETTLTDAGNNINEVRWSDDGAWFATASDDNNIYVYSVVYASFSGTVTDTNSNAVEGATVYAINDSDGTITGKTTTAADGTYSIDAEDTTTDHHLIVQYDDGTTKYNGLSKPYVTAVEG